MRNASQGGFSIVREDARQFFANLLNAPEARAEYMALGLIADIEGLREKQGLTYTALAERMGVSRAYVSKLMQGRQNSTLGSLVKLAEALGAEIDVRVRLQRKTHSNGSANGHPDLPKAKSGKASAAAKR